MINNNNNKVTCQQYVSTKIVWRRRPMVLPARSDINCKVCELSWRKHYASQGDAKRKSRL